MKKLLKKKLSLSLVLIFILSIIQINVLTVFADTNSDFTIDAHGVLTKYNGEVVIPDGVTSIVAGEYRDCINLTNITIPNSVTSIGVSAFEDCINLTSITIPNSVKSIGVRAFYGCTNLTSITISNGVESIGIGAFRGCTSLTSITIPNSVKSIGIQAFRGCTSLTSITISNSITSIGLNAFSMESNVVSESKNIDITIYGKNGSAAETYAKRNNIPFIISSENQPIKQAIVVNKGSNSDLTKYLNLNGINISWGNSNINVANVNDGVVTAIGTGTSTITAVGQDGTQYGLFTINVTNNITTGGLNTIRLGGTDRYDTSTVISQVGWRQGSTYAVLATGNNYPDALSAAPLAQKYNAPILLTDKDSIPQSLLTEIKRLNVNNIFICGGIGVVSQAVENQLNSMSITTERLGGKDRYETSVLIAKKLGVLSGENMVTNGNEWSDALSASSIAAKKGIPILLSDKDVLPDSTNDFISARNFSKTYILGDTDLISDAVANKFPNQERIIGSTQYERNINIIKRFQKDIDLSNICIATGTNFPDALSGSALAAMVSSAIVLVDNSDLQDITTQYASQNLMQVNNAYIFGQQGAVSDVIIKELFNK